MSTKRRYVGKVQQERMKQEHEHCCICLGQLNVRDHRHDDDGDKSDNPRRRAKVFTTLCHHLSATYRSQDWNLPDSPLALCKHCMYSATNILDLHEKIDILKVKLQILVEGVTKRIIFASRKGSVRDSGCGNDKNCSACQSNQIAQFHGQALNRVTFDGLVDANDPSEITLIGKSVSEERQRHYSLLDPVVNISRMPNLSCSLLPVRPVQIKEEILDECAQNYEERDIWVDSDAQDDGHFSLDINTGPECETDLQFDVKSHIVIDGNSCDIQSSSPKIPPKSKPAKFTPFFAKQDGRLQHKGFEVLKREIGYECLTCGKILKKLFSMVDHVKTEHLGVKNRCDFEGCGKTYSSKYKLLNHQKLGHAHREEKPKSKFLRNRKLHEGKPQAKSSNRKRVEHQNGHTRCEENASSNNPKMYPCPVCQKPLRSPSSLRRHSWSHLNQEEINSRLAAGESMPSEKLRNLKYPCRFCGKCFVRPHLALHEKTHSSISERKYICTKCPREKTFWTQAHLTQHEVVTHLADRNRFRCSLCSMGFPTRQRLKKHRWTHTGETPYICTTCGKGFRSDWSHKNHQIVHQDENVRPYKCDTCSKTFRHPTGLKRHKRKRKCGQPDLE